MHVAGFAIWYIIEFILQFFSRAAGIECKIENVSEKLNLCILILKMNEFNLISYYHSDQIGTREGENGKETFNFFLPREAKETIPKGNDS